MNVYTTEEEQVESIKRFLKRYGPMILTTVATICLLMAGWQFWHRHQEDLREKSALAYAQLLLSASNEDTEGLKQKAQYLIKDYAKTPYAALAALMLAREAVHVNQLDVAKRHIAWVIDHAQQAAVKQIAQTRMARILLAQKQYSEALVALDAVEGEVYAGTIAAIRGDILFAQGNISEARESYALALKHLPREARIRQVLTIKMNDLAIENKEKT